MDVSIIIRTYNEEKSIKECLKKVFAQEAKFSFEVIIIDSGSTDKTLSRARKFSVKIKKIKKSDFTYGRSLNIGCEAAKGEFLVFLSAHATPIHTDWLSTLITNFKNKKNGGVYGKQIPRKDCNPLMRRHLEAHWSDEKKVQKKDSFFHNANAAVRKEVWEKIKFDETLGCSEDHDWAKKAQQQGLNIIYEPRAVVYHSHNESLQQFYKRNYNEIYSSFSIYGQQVYLKGIISAISNLSMDWRYIMRKKQKPYWLCRSFLHSTLSVTASTHAFLRYNL